MNQASRGRAQDAAGEQPTRERASFRWLHHDAGTGSLGRHLSVLLVTDWLARSRPGQDIRLLMAPPLPRR